MGFYFPTKISGMITLLFLLTSCVTPARNQIKAREAKSLHYTLTYISPSRLDVEATFSASSSKETRIVLPTDMYNQERPLTGFTNFEVLNEEADVVAGFGALRTVHHKAGERLRFKYSMIQKDPEFRTTQPIINSEYFHFNGSLFIHPEQARTENTRIVIDWQIPANWSLANSFGTELRHQEFEGHFGTKPTDNIKMSVFVAGDFRLHQITIAQHPILFAVRGKWKFSDQEFKKIITQVIQSQRSFWRDFEVPYYFITLLPNGKRGVAGGHGLTHSFGAYFPKEEEDLTRFTRILAHEHFHFWNGEKMAPEAEGPEFWFTEGFTDYFAKQLNLRSGLTSWSDYVNDVNETIQTYYQSPVRDADNAQVAKEFFTNPEIAKMIYARGLLVASEWNELIRKSSSGKLSLDDFMRSLFSQIFAEKKALSNSLIKENLKAIIGPQAEKVFDDDVTYGRTLKLSSHALGPCATLVSKNRSSAPQYKDLSSKSENCVSWFGSISDF